MALNTLDIFIAIADKKNPRFTRRAKADKKSKVYPMGDS